MSSKKNLVLVAMVFAVGMTFIDQTIVAIAIPRIQRELSLSATGAQWVINGYLLALSALFAFGGKLGDVRGRRRMVVIGVIGFAVTSAACGFTPKGSVAQAWIIVFRILQGASAALLFPAAVGIVVSAFPVRERGRAMAIFFGVAGGLTAIGPIAGGYLTQWTWRSIFWINIPVAIIALLLIRRKPRGGDAGAGHAARLPRRGFDLGRDGACSCSDSSSRACGAGAAPRPGYRLIVGVLLMVAFVRWELHTPEPLLRLRIFSDRGFAADTAVLGMMSVVFVPFFFFASVYSQVSLGKTPHRRASISSISSSGYVIASQVGGRILDRRGARPAIVFGCAIGAVGFFLLAGKLTDLSLNKQWLYVAIAGAGIGLMLTPSEHRRGQSCPEHRLQRGHRHHPDRPQLRGQPRLGGPRHDPHPQGEHERHQRAHQGRRAKWRTAHRVAASFGLGAVRVRIERRAAARDRACAYSWRSPTRPRPFSTSWEASWQQHSSSRSGGFPAAAWRSPMGSLWKTASPGSS